MRVLLLIRIHSDRGHDHTSYPWWFNDWAIVDVPEPFQHNEPVWVDKVPCAS